jgi:hypothetical protein
MAARPASVAVLTLAGWCALMMPAALPVEPAGTNATSPEDEMPRLHTVARATVVTDFGTSRATTTSSSSSSSTSGGSSRYVCALLYPNALTLDVRQSHSPPFLF